MGILGKKQSGVILFECSVVLILCAMLIPTINKLIINQSKKTTQFTVSVNQMINEVNDIYKTMNTSSVQNVEKIKLCKAKYFFYACK